MIGNLSKMAVGSLMIAAVLIGYLPQPQYLVELTCISNTLGGLLLLTDGALHMVKKKSLPHSFYLNVSASILIVFLVCMGSLTGVYQFNFQGAFFFLHVIDPIAFVVCYMLFVDERGRKTRAVLAAPLLTMAYLLFDCIRCRLTGEFVYGFMEPEKLTFWGVIAAEAVVYVLICLLGLGLFALNKRVHKKRARRRPAC